MSKSNKGQDDGLTAMMDLWRQGQEAFVKAQAEMGETFQKSLGALAEDVVKPPKADSPMENMGVNFAEAGEKAFLAWQDFLKAWSPVSSPMGGFNDMLLKQGFAGFPDFGTGGLLTPFSMGGADIAAQMLDPKSWSPCAPDELRKILQVVADGPRFADLATPQLEAAAAWREVIDYQKAAADLFTEVQGAWGRTYERYAKDNALEDLKSGNAPEALKAWLAAANAELLETQRTPGFMDAQKRMMRAGLEIKLRQKEIAEQWCETWQMPTRTEVDDLSKMVQELRREVRKLKRELAKKS
ncbi:MAG: poly(R)-hydroxyalkanoic acid synthase subunit PhaE [Pseudomonadota bacterium]